MKKFFLSSVILFFTTILLAQKDVTRFLGIPVDGFKPEMIQKLKEKGFVSYESDGEILTGEFNGTQVNVSIVTTNNKVSRIALCDVNLSDETGIRIRFNRLCKQFENNSKYTSLGDYTIPEDEDISYEMKIHNKRYEAAFHQKPEDLDSIAVVNMLNDIKNVLSQKYSEQELENPTEEIQEETTDMRLSYMMDRYNKKSVWFMIAESYGKYYIAMFYDNEYNRANGEDL